MELTDGRWRKEHRGLCWKLRTPGCYDSAVQPLESSFWALALGRQRDDYIGEQEDKDPGLMDLAEKAINNSSQITTIETGAENGKFAIFWEP